MEKLELEQLENIEGGGYFDCLRGFFNSDAGTATEAGLAIGATALALGAATAGTALVVVGGFYTSVAMLGCLPAIGAE